MSYWTCMLNIHFLIWTCSDVPQSQLVWQNSRWMSEQSRTRDRVESFCSFQHRLTCRMKFLINERRMLSKWNITVICITVWTIKKKSEIRPLTLNLSLKITEKEIVMYKALRWNTSSFGHIYSYLTQEVCTVNFL